MWNDASLDPFVHKGDPLADHTIAAISGELRSEGMQKSLARLRRNADEIPAHLPEALQTYLQDTARLPEWADLEAIQTAQELFARHGIQIVLTLFCIVLPEGYAIWKPTWILHRTNNLGSFIHRRIVETAQFLLDVMEPGGFGPDGSAMRSIQKVRLMHAAARKYIWQQPDWNPDWGTPIHQEDMAATIGGFSYLSLEGLEKLNVNLTTAEQEAYLHTWWVIGSMLGVDEQLRFNSMSSAAEFMQSYRRRGRGSSAQGREMTEQLVGFMNSRLPVASLRGLPEAMMCYLLDSETAALIGLTQKEHPMIPSIRGVSGLLDRMQHRSRRLRRISGRLVFALLERMLWSQKQGDPVHFQIPVVLRKRWHIEAVYRRLERLDWRQEGRVYIRIRSGETWQCRPINISPGGIRLRFLPQGELGFDTILPDLFQPGQRVHLRFALPGQNSFTVRGEIRHWSDFSKGPELGIRFLKRDMQGRRRVHRLLQSDLTQPDSVLSGKES